MPTHKTKESYLGNIQPKKTCHLYCRHGAQLCMLTLFLSSLPNVLINFVNRELGRDKITFDKMIDISYKNYVFKHIFCEQISIKKIVKEKHRIFIYLRFDFENEYFALNCNSFQLI